MHPLINSEHCYCLTGGLLRADSVQEWRGSTDWRIPLRDCQPAQQEGAPPGGRPRHLPGFFFLLCLNYIYPKVLCKVLIQIRIPSVGISCKSVFTVSQYPVSFIKYHICIASVADPSIIKGSEWPMKNGWGWGAGKCSKMVSDRGDRCLFTF